MHLVHNKRVKLLSDALNTLGIAVLVTGAVAPMLSVVYGTFAATSTPLLALIASACLVVGVSLDASAQVVLGRLSGCLISGSKP